MAENLSGKPFPSRVLVRFAMRLTLIDRITDLQPGKRITATKSLSLSESYLKDHFPRFPVMPGVLMLEAMYQTAAWLVRVTDGFSHSMVTLAEANNVKYSDFVVPGQTLTLTAELLRQERSQYKLKCQGELLDKVAVRGRLVLETARLADLDPRDEAVDQHVLFALRKKFRLLYPDHVHESSQT